MIVYFLHPEPIFIYAPASSIPAGDNINLTCAISLSMSSRFNHTPVFQWKGPAGFAATLEPMVLDEMTASSTLNLHEVQASQAGVYSCNATFNDTALFTSIELNILGMLYIIFFLSF